MTKGGKMRKIITLIFIGLFLASTAVAGTRPAGYYGIGPRVGFTVNPDQIHFGGHVDFGEIANNLMMVPNLEIGIGDNLTTIAPSFELDYRFRSDWGVWSPYLGGSAGPIFYSPEHGGSDTQFGLYIQGGIMKGLSGRNSGYFFLEAKLGLADAPDAKFTAGWTFGR
ncbi:MAG: hypothetical protein A2W25_07130 [candidate division Zixibacteria bacterium RBG_16_53_22]|nr:MAG: hypothetical protein A2W25_07130 [candidate division Zixibacteria bacterium RBG_16_53_22]